MYKKYKESHEMHGITVEYIIVSNVPSTNSKLRICLTFIAAL